MKHLKILLLANTMFALTSPMDFRKCPKKIYKVDVGIIAEELLQIKREMKKIAREVEIHEEKKFAKLVKQCENFAEDCVEYVEELSKQGEIHE